MSMHPDLEWLASHVSEWPEGYGSCDVVVDDTVLPYGRRVEYKKEGGKWSFFDWNLARDAWLESPEVTEAEDEAWEAMEEKQASNRSKYHREIKPGVWVDVYDVLHAWRVQNPALQHLIKKSLQPGERGHKTRGEDMKDIIASALRAGELGE